MLLNDFSNPAINKYMRKLTPSESVEISSLFEKRQVLNEMIHEERTRDNKIRKKTKKEWETFLKIINDLSDCEKRVIQVITGNNSVRDKVKEIKSYNKKISDIERGKYYLNGKQLNLLYLYKVICERMETSNACAKTMRGYPFVLSPALFELAVSLHTYNSVFIAFHLFRLEPKVTNATSFISLALECINRNLDQEVNTPDKSSIEDFASNIETQDTNGILQIKAKIKKEISRYPDCDDKLLYAEWLDSISDRISTALISICKKAEDNYLEIKNRITSSLGEKCSILPSSSIDSLTTAEMLFQRYAKEEYAYKGFDYSCISALYYQAFEDAYNELIWAKYASYLNSLTVSGSNYTNILKRHKNSKVARITETDARGYLFDDDLRQRNYYVLYHSGTASVNTRCMYKSFAIIMEQLKNPTDLNGFCEFIAQLCGFTGRTDMFSDTAFMQKCHDFTDEISKSADNRNNASHGGSFISLGQCTNDKKTILNNLESIRCESVGLIQQLLYILQKD